MVNCENISTLLLDEAVGAIDNVRDLDDNMMVYYWWPCCGLPWDCEWWWVENKEKNLR